MARDTRLKRPRRGALVLWLVTAAHANPPPVPASVRTMLGVATVLVLPSRCAGAVVEAPWLVATAKHCIDDGGFRLPWDGSGPTHG